MGTKTVAAVPRRSSLRDRSTSLRTRNPYSHLTGIPPQEWMLDQAIMSRCRGHLDVLLLPHGVRMIGQCMLPNATHHPVVLLRLQDRTTDQHLPLLNAYSPPLLREVDENIYQCPHPPRCNFSRFRSRSV